MLCVVIASESACDTDDSKHDDDNVLQQVILKIIL